MAAKHFIRTALLCGSCLLLLAGCDNWATHWTSADAHPAAAPQPQVKIMQTADASWIASTGQPVAHTVPEPANADKDAMDRLTTLEHQVAQMQNDMNTMMPVLTRLVAVQTDIQSMLTRLQANGAVPPGATAAMTTPDAGAAHDPVPLAQPPPMADAPPSLPLPTAPPPPDALSMPVPPPASAPPQMPPVGPAALADPPPPAGAPPATAAASTTTTTTTTTAAAPASAATPPPAPDAAPAVTIKDVRLGEHPGSTRVVIDLSDKAGFTSDVDNTEHLLTIDVKGAGWKGVATPKQIAGSPLLASWQAGPDGQGGTRIVMQLRKQAKVASTQALPATHGQDARIVIDLAAS